MNLTAAAARTPLGIPDDAAETGRISVVNYLAVCAQLVLLLLLLRQFQIESIAFLRLAVLAFGGFAVHARLPLRMRLPFFSDTQLRRDGCWDGGVNAAWFMAIGLGLVGICHRLCPSRCAAHCSGLCRPPHAATRRPRAVSLVGCDLADSRRDVHVPSDRLLLRPAP